MRRLSLLAMVMATGKSTTTPPKATLRSSGSGLVHVRSGLFSLLAVPGLGFLQLTSGATTTTITSTSTASTTIGTAIATSTGTAAFTSDTTRTNTPDDDHCRVTFLYPRGDGLEFYHLDTLNVTYQSFFSNPTLHCWCNEPNSNQVIERKCLSFLSPRAPRTARFIVFASPTSLAAASFFLLLSFYPFLQRHLHIYAPRTAAASLHFGAASIPQPPIC